MKEIRCKECKWCEFSDGKGRPNRYYCTHPHNPNSMNMVSANTLITKTDRNSMEMKIKQTPKWCPLKPPEV